MFGLGVVEIAIILGAALIFIGPKKLPELARGLGKGLKEFQNAAKGISASLNEPVKNTVDELKKDMPSFEEEFKDDPPHDHGDGDFVSSQTDDDPQAKKEESDK